MNFRAACQGCQAGESAVKCISQRHSCLAQIGLSRKRANR